MAPNNTMGHAGQHPPRHSSLENQLDGGQQSTASAQEGGNEGFRGQNYSHGVVASHYQAHLPPRAREGETWMDFLADPNIHHPPRMNPGANNAAALSHSASHSSSSRYTLPNRPSRTDSSSSRGSDRKRRLTTADSPMRRPSSIRMHSTTAGTTNSDPIVLESSPAPERALPPVPPPPPPPPFEPQPNTAPLRRSSDIVLPPWQPDADVSRCPVCGKSFTFLFRKHHCRKCGRVVCAQCSPHRITIPRQFIVHPPSDGASNVIDLTGDDDTAMSSFGPYRNPALGGGEEVRVCNPCVPDPNYGPPPQYNPTASSRYAGHLTYTPRPYFPPGQPPHPRAHRSSSSVHDTLRTTASNQTHRSHDSSNDSRRTSYHGGSERWPPFTAANMPRPPEHNSQTSRYTTPNNGSLPFNLGPGTQSVVNMFPRSQFTAVPPPNMPSSRPRRQIAEEDECPICGNELPPKGPNDDEADRTQHIEECIALHSASPAPALLTQTTSASLPTQRTRGMSNANAGEGASASRMAHTARGMFPFTATEKDCVDADGEVEECIICFEEYEAGDKMARLVCWCKFHEKCIRNWWDKKGRGACPTHQLHE